jgi:hypothetical protein
MLARLKLELAIEGFWDAALLALGAWWAVISWQGFIANLAAAARALGAPF